MSSSAVSNCSAESGAALFVTGRSSLSAATVRLTDTVLTGNRASGKAAHGGALSAYFADVAAANVTIRGNTVTLVALGSGPFDRVAEITPFAAGAGGGLFLVLSTADLDRLTKARLSFPPARRLGCRRISPDNTYRDTFASTSHCAGGG